MLRPGSGSVSLAVVLALTLVAGPALSHSANLTFTFLEGDGCPEDRLNCIRVTGGPGTQGNITDDTAEVRFKGVHPIEITVENDGQFDHNLTFQPNSPLANYSVDDPIPPGESVTFNFTTIEDVEAGSYAFYGGQPGHRDLGERGKFVIKAGPEPEPDQSDIVQEVVGIPGPGLGVALVALALASVTASRRR